MDSSPDWTRDGSSWPGRITQTTTGRYGGVTLAAEDPKLLTTPEGRDHPGIRRLSCDPYPVYQKVD